MASVFRGASYSINSETSVYGNYGRNYAFPQSWPNLLSNFIASQSDYTKAGETIQYLANQIKLGTSDNYELGVRYNNKRFSIVPDVFYSDYQNKLFSVYDPTVSQSVPQAVGEEKVYGAELEARPQPNRNLRAFGSISYNKSQIESNMPDRGDYVCRCQRERGARHPADSRQDRRYLQPLRRGDNTPSPGMWIHATAMC